MKRALSFLMGAAFIAAPLALAQDHPRNTGEVPRYFTATCAGTLSAAAVACTLQQPASGANNVRVMWAQVKCSVSCDPTVERNGTAATATAGTIKSVNPDKTDLPAVKLFTASDVGSGTVITGTPLTQSAGVPGLIDLTGIFLIGSGTSKNVSVKLATMTGDYSITYKVEEYN